MLRLSRVGIHGEGRPEWVGTPLGGKQGKLDEAQAAAEIEVKGEGARVTRRADAGDMASRLWAKGVIEGGQDRGRGDKG
jgi:hypothetical protein